MTQAHKLLKRLDAIGLALAQTGQGRALIGLGSVGMEVDRLDEYSDLDFFAIVRPGQKAGFVADPNWMAAAYPIAYFFQNTIDGHKLLFADGIFAEMAVFEESELARIPFARGRIVWQEADFDPALAAPPERTPDPLRTLEWSLGEALTNLYVGLGRFRRGEMLAGARLVQGHALDRLVELSAWIEVEQPVASDPFAGERRFEQRFPSVAASLPRFMQGYERTPESARAILLFLDQHFEINSALRAAILALC